MVPWPGTDLVYLGTTDTDYTGPLDDPACTPEDVDLLEAANNITTSAPDWADVTGVWAGLRPLLSPQGGHVSARTADLSRRHTVMTSSDGVVTVTGGKLTTYRKMAQDTVDAVVQALGESRKRRRCVARRATSRAHQGARSRLDGSAPSHASPVATAAESPDVPRPRPRSARTAFEPAIAGLPYMRGLVYAQRGDGADARRPAVTKGAP